jgi:hypothetical protein
VRSPTSLAVAVVASATLLVVGLDYATFATTGDSLLLGKSNASRTATSIERSEPGSALRLLTSSSDDAPMTVNGQAKVVNLNADKIDGKDASQLGGHTVSYLAGQRGDTVAEMGLWSTPVPAGNYEVTFRAILFPGDDQIDELSIVICGVVDSTKLNGNPHLYTAETALLTSGFPAAMSGTNAVIVTEDAEPAAVCFSPTGSITLFKSVAVNFTKLSSRVVRDAEPLELPGKRWHHEVFGR